MSGARAQDVIDRIEAADEQILCGDPQYWKELVSHREDVTLLGAYGGYARGWPEVSARFDRVAATYGGSGTTSRKNISTWIGIDLACVVDLEYHRAALDGNAEPTEFVYRTTHLLRREDDGWRIVLRHADPVATFRGPEFAHAAK